MPAELCANNAAKPVDDVEHALRQTRFMKASVRICVCIALISLGLMTIVVPAAMAVASFEVMKPILLFHGVMAAATPEAA